MLGSSQLFGFVSHFSFQQYLLLVFPDLISRVNLRNPETHSFAPISLGCDAFWIDFDLLINL
jgi:hypothetical protein